MIVTTRDIQNNRTIIRFTCDGEVPFMPTTSDHNAKFCRVWYEVKSTYDAMPSDVVPAHLGWRIDADGRHCYCPTHALVNDMARIDAEYVFAKLTDRIDKLQERVEQLEANLRNLSDQALWTTPMQASSQDPGFAWHRGNMTGYPRQAKR